MFSSKQKIEKDRLQYEQDIDKYKPLVSKNINLMKDCQRDIIHLMFSNNNNANNYYFSDAFLIAIAQIKAERMVGSMYRIKYSNKTGNLYTRNKDFDLYDHFKYYYDMYVKKRANKKLFQEIDTYDFMPFTTNDNNTVWFTLDNGNPFFSIYFVYDQGEVTIASDGDE